MSYVQRALSKTIPATNLIDVEDKEKARATTFKILQKEEFAEAMKSLTAEKEIPKKIKTFNHYHLLTSKDSFVSSAE